MHQTYWRRPSSVVVSIQHRDTMKIAKLNRIINQFWTDESHNDKYHFGLCSEFAIALQRYLNSGQLYKAGLMHTFLKYKSSYCDIRGCFTPSEYTFKVPSPSYTPATKSEIQHIKSLLDEKEVSHIIKGLKKAERK